MLYVAASGRQAESRPARDKEKTRTSGRFLPTQVAASLLCPAEQASPKRQARKDRVGPGFSRVSKKDKPEKTGRVGSAEIGGKTGSGRVRVGLTRFFFPFFSAINRSDIGSSKYTAIRDPARCREAHEAPYLHREHHDKLRGRWAGGSCNRVM